MCETKPFLTERQVNKTAAAPTVTFDTAWAGTKGGSSDYSLSLSESFRTRYSERVPMRTLGPQMPRPELM